MSELYVATTGVHLSGDDVLRRELRLRFGVDAGTVRIARACPHCGSDRHGRPVVLGWPDGPPPEVSLARCRDLTVVAFSAAGPVGVDVERSDAASFAGFPDMALHPDEHAGNHLERTRTWVRKESLLKATGEGLSVSPDRLRLSAPGAPPELVSWDGGGGPTSPVWMYDVVTVPGHVVAATVLAPHRPELRT